MTVTTLSPGTTILRNRYTVETCQGTAMTTETYVAYDEYESRFFIKVWRYREKTPDPIQRALWDSELRVLYRVCSTPGVDESLLVLRDSGIDQNHKCFIMVLDAPGYTPLDEMLRDRGSHGWLRSDDNDNRRVLWSALRRLATGLVLLHEQSILHRNIDARVVYVDAQQGIDSMRLGGFEWSVRLGTQAGTSPPSGWALPPEFFEDQFDSGYSLETDWYGFGILATRCLLNVENHASNSPKERHRRIERAIQDSRHLGDVEKRLLIRLIAKSPKDRLTHAPDIIKTIDDIDRGLSQPIRLQADKRKLVLIINPRSTQFVDDAVERGYVPDPENPNSHYNPQDSTHESTLRSFIQADLRHAQLYAVPKAEFFLLNGEKCILRITKHNERSQDGTTRPTWNYAFAVGFGEIRGNNGGNQCINLPTGGITVRTLVDFKKHRRTISEQAQSWHSFLPKIDQAAKQRAHLTKFFDFIRCTNQLELLIRDAEIFRYEVVTVPEHPEDGHEEIVIREIPREKQRPEFCQIDGGMAEFLQREKDMSKSATVRVMLTPSDDDGLYLRDQVDLAEAWWIEEIDRKEGVVRLARVKAGNTTEVPRVGTVRSWGMFGQIALVKRRKQAIDKLRRHLFLLRSLSVPAQVYMDTGDAKPPTPIPLREDKVDNAKRAAIQDILRVRPLYTLQGPPGTGKTTLVAHLLRQILADDVVAQVLITAQAHGAVDVLMNKVDKEAFVDVAVADRPLAVRLGRKDDVGEHSVEAVSERILDGAIQRIRELEQRSEIQQHWLKAALDLHGAIRSNSSGNTAADFRELVKRGANITYCTTSARDLEELAETSQSFDWSIVEEAGKAHGFDLALPLQLGHRWLLIGDHQQLPPYRFSDYYRGIEQLDIAISALDELSGPSGLVDVEWIRKWRDWSHEEQIEFQEYAKHWLYTFRQLFILNSATRNELTLDKPIGAPAGMLSGQHRMHPTIGTLISETYYDGLLRNETDTSEGPLDRVRHSFIRPDGIAGRALVWIDVNWANDDPSCAEQGPTEGRPRYVNPKEVDALVAFLSSLEVKGHEDIDLAVLSPYAQQVAMINRTFRSYQGRFHGLHFTRGDDTEQQNRRYAHTVDSFQGNQADVICVSLVRNNDKKIGEGLGFLGEKARLNVLLSRAERLLVLVGSWSFFKHQVSNVDPEDSDDLLWHWWKVLNMFEKAFSEGTGVKFQASELEGGE